jgi:exodeoxyribonuclease V beta subunit
MLRQVHATLTGPDAGRLLGPLRKQYRYAFVDEFQDTDPIQWRIFARIFIESDTHRLFLIGDPKQAIYSFRRGCVYLSVSPVSDGTIGR